MKWRNVYPGSTDLKRDFYKVIICRNPTNFHDSTMFLWICESLNPRRKLSLRLLHSINLGFARTTERPPTAFKMRSSRFKVNFQFPASFYPARGSIWITRWWKLPATQAEKLRKLFANRAPAECTATYDHINVT